MLRGEAGGAQENRYMRVFDACVCASNRAEGGRLCGEAVACGATSGWVCGSGVALLPDGLCLIQVPAGLLPGRLVVAAVFQMTADMVGELLFAGVK